MNEIIEGFLFKNVEDDVVFVICEIICCGVEGCLIFVSELIEYDGLWGWVWMGRSLIWWYIGNLYYFGWEWECEGGMEWCDVFGVCMGCLGIVIFCE